MPDPCFDSSVKKADSFDSGIHEPPDQAGGRHDAIRVTAVDDDSRLRVDAKMFERIRKGASLHDVRLFGVVVMGIILFAIQSGLQIRGVNLNRSGDMSKDGHLRIEGVVDRGEVRFQHDEITGICRGTLGFQQIFRADQSELFLVM